MDDKLNPIIQAYRHKETQPTKLNRGAIVQLAQASASAVKLGMPKIGINNLADKILLEGRADAGANEYNENNPRAEALFNKLIDMGYSRNAAIYPAAVLDKSEVATRLNIPFELAWNGTGKNARADGQRHTARAKVMEGASKDPKNSELVDTINRAISGESTSQENLLNVSDLKLLPALVPGAVVAENKLDWKSTGSLIANFESTANKIGIKGDKLSGLMERVRSRGSQFDLAWAMPALYKNASGINTEDSGYNNYVKQMNSDPDSKAVLDVMLGIDPGGDKYKAANQKPKAPESPGIIDSILSLLK